MAPGSRTLAYVVSALALGAVLYPARFHPSDRKHDSFPLSTYPMFSRNKPRTSRFTRVVAIGPAGDEHAIPPELVVGGEAMQAMRTIRKSVRGGPKQARAFCGAVARRVAHSALPELAHVTYVALDTIKVNSIAYLSGRRTPLSREEHVRCPVLRPAS
jgi:hypothetical protein